MATVIRLKRGGRTHAPYYRMIVVDSRTRARGREIDLIGIYHPCARPAPITEVDRAKALDWLFRGARPSDTVRDVLSKKGIMAEFAAGKKAQPVVEAVAPVMAEAVEPVVLPDSRLRGNDDGGLEEGSAEPSAAE